MIKVTKTLKEKELEEYLVKNMCKIACKFYKEGDTIDENEKFQCGGYKIMKHQLNTAMLDKKTFEAISKNVDVKNSIDQPLSELDKFLVKNLCKVACGFYTEDEHGEGDEYLQCGGYRMIREQIKKKIIDKESVKKLAESSNQN